MSRQTMATKTVRNISISNIYEKYTLKSKPLGALTTNSLKLQSIFKSLPFLVLNTQDLHVGLYYVKIKGNIRLIVLLMR